LSAPKANEITAPIERPMIAHRVPCPRCSIAASLATQHDAIIGDGEQVPMQQAAVVSGSARAEPRI